MTFDANTQRELGKVFPDLAARWLAAAEQMHAAHKLPIRITSGLRTFAEQWAIYEKGRKREKGGEWIIKDIKKVVTYAMPGQSYHQYGLALDICFQGPDPYLEKIDKKDSEFLWSEYGRICKENGLTWGGDWKEAKRDRPHCELTFGLSYHALQILYEDGGLNGVWNKCNVLNACGREIA